MAPCAFGKTAEPNEARVRANGVGEPLCAQAVDGATLRILPRPVRVRV